MGDRGPQKESVELQARKGNPSRRKPPENTTQQTALTKLPTTPKHLSDTAKTEWRRAGQKFIDIGKLTPTNLKALEMYCVNYGIACEQLEILDIEGYTLIASKSGYRMPHPAIAIMNKAQKEARDWFKVLDKTTAQKVSKKKSALEEFRDRKKGIRRVK